MTLTLERLSPTSARVSRSFAAAPAAVYRAHTDADLMRKWMLGPDGWVIDDCVSEAQPGGTLRIVWRQPSSGAGFSLTGEYLALDAPHRIDHVERMHLPDPTPDNLCVTTFTATDTGCRLDLTMTLPDADSLEAMLATGMTSGMEASYARLEASL